jgi:endonuclease/exonuclease/phosphatase family metal-dependent hydrolase
MKGLRESLLVALLFVTTAELLRANGPLLDNVAGAIGIVAAASVAVALYLLPGALLATVRQTILPGLVALLVLVRFVAQLAPSLPIVGAGAVLGLVCLALAALRSLDAVSAVTGLLIGGSLDLALRSATTTWDLIWAGGWGLFQLILPIAAFFLAFLDPGKPSPLGRAWVVGAYLALWTTTIGNPAFFSRVRLQPAIIVALLGIVVAVELTRRLALRRFVGVPALVGVVGGTVAAWWGTGWQTVGGVVAVQVFAAICVARALASGGKRGSWSLGLIWVLPVLLYQVHYDMPLPFDNRYLVVGAAVVVGLSGLSRRRLDVPVVEKKREELPPGTLPLKRPLPQLLTPVSLALAGLVLIPLGLMVIRPGAAVAEQGSSLRLMTWNVKYGRDDASGQVNPAQLAETIRRQDADLVLLQEVSRGWAIGGGLDLAEWLARDLGMEYHWGPAADDMFGNLLLVPKDRKVAVSHHYLPFGQGPMRRSYLLVTVDGIDIVSTHLTHRKQNTPTRLDQIRTILEEKPDVVLGDLNFWPSWDERRAFESAGFVSAQDMTGNGALFTSPASRPTNRVDWVWGKRMEFSDFRIVSETKASDHFPLVVVVRPV